MIILNRISLLGCFILMASVVACGSSGDGASPNKAPSISGIPKANIGRFQASCRLKLKNYATFLSFSTTFCFSGFR